MLWADSNREARVQQLGVDHTRPMMCNNRRDEMRLLLLFSLGSYHFNHKYTAHAQAALTISQGFA